MNLIDQAELIVSRKGKCFLNCDTCITTILKWHMCSNTKLMYLCINYLEENKTVIKKPKYW